MEALTADKALDKASHEGLMLLCFARAEDVAPVEKFLDRYAQTKAVKMVRVDPVLEHAKLLQLAKFPTFILYDNGCERFTVVGTSTLIETLERKL